MSFQRTWDTTTHTNIVVAHEATALDCNRRWWLTVMSLYLTVPGVSVWKSCNSVAVATGTSNWTNLGDLVWKQPDSSHPADVCSWIVLKFANGMQLCFRLAKSVDGSNVADSVGGSIRITSSASGAFTGGSTSAPPTAVDVTTVLASTWDPATSNTNNWLGANPIANAYVLQMTWSLDGKYVVLVGMKSSGDAGGFPNYGAQNQVVVMTVDDVFDPTYQHGVMLNTVYAFVGKAALATGTGGDLVGGGVSVGALSEAGNDDGYPIGNGYNNGRQSLWQIEVLLEGSSFGPIGYFRDIYNVTPSPTAEFGRIYVTPNGDRYAVVSGFAIPWGAGSLLYDGNLAPANNTSPAYVAGILGGAPQSPSFQRAWDTTTHTNVIIAHEATPIDCNRRWWLTVIAMYLTVPGVSVWKSCNSVAVISGASNWINLGDLVWKRTDALHPAEVCSWIVLNFANGLQLLFRLAPSNVETDTLDTVGGTITIGVSASGLYVGGSTSAPPTATDFTSGNALRLNVSWDAITRPFQPWLGAVPAVNCYVVHLTWSLDGMYVVLSSMKSGGDIAGNPHFGAQNSIVVATIDDVFDPVYQHSPMLAVAIGFFGGGVPLNTNHAVGHPDIVETIGAANLIVTQRGNDGGAAVGNGYYNAKRTLWQAQIFGAGDFFAPLGWLRDVYDIESIGAQGNAIYVTPNGDRYAIIQSFAIPWGAGPLRFDGNIAPVDNPIPAYIGAILGARIPVAIVSTYAISANEVIVNMNSSLLVRSTVLGGDASNPASWKIVRTDTNELVPVVLVQVNSSTQFVLHVQPQLPAQGVSLVLDAGHVLDATGVPVSSSATFAGVTEQAFSTPALAASGRTSTPRDLANYQTAGTSISGTLVVRGGDYATETGNELLRKLIIRRLIARVGDFYHLPTYGVGLRVKQPIPAGDLVKLQTQIRQQIQQETGVASVTVQLTQSANLLYVALVVFTQTGQKLDIGVPFSIGGAS